MNRNRIVACSALGLSLALTACNVPDTSDSESPAVIDDASDIDAPEQQESAAATPQDEVLTVIDVAKGIQRHVTRRSMEPTAELTTHTGSYVAIWVRDNGTSAIFEGIPAGARSALKEVHADSPTDLFVALAPKGTEPPAGLSKGRPFSELTAEAAERLAKLSPEDLVIVDDGDQGQQAAQQVMVGTSCSKDDANYFYNNFRPGVFTSDEGSPEYTPSGYQYPKAQRRIDYQAFFQTNYDQWTPQQSSGGFQAAYYRAAALMCTGSARLTVFLCYGNQGTADNGCGEPGSSIDQTHGPYTMSAGSGGVFQIFPGGDIGRARLDQMSSGSDHAMWSVMGNNGGYGAINNCFN